MLRIGGQNPATFFQVPGAVPQPSAGSWQDFMKAQGFNDKFEVHPDAITSA